jgi:hypothetical protein
VNVGSRGVKEFADTIGVQAMSRPGLKLYIGWELPAACGPNGCEHVYPWDAMNLKWSRSKARPTTGRSPFEGATWSLFMT